jgi:two-component system nitrate/nitrite sensor histidine kinase NarX
MNATVFSEELQNAARHDQDSQLKALQQYWQLELAPGMKQAQNQATVATDVASFVDRIDHLVTAFDHTTEQRIRYVVWMQRMMAIGMALLLVFTIVWLRARLLRPWKQLLAWPGRSAIAILPSAPDQRPQRDGEPRYGAEQHV